MTTELKLSAGQEQLVGDIAKFIDTCVSIPDGDELKNITMALCQIVVKYTVSNKKKIDASAPVTATADVSVEEKPAKVVRAKKAAKTEESVASASAPVSSTTESSVVSESKPAKVVRAKKAKPADAPPADDAPKANGVAHADVVEPGVATETKAKKGKSKKAVEAVEAVEAVADVVPTEEKKKRKPTAYNMFVKEFSKLPECDGVSQTEKMKLAGLAWKSEKGDAWRLAHPAEEPVSA